MPAVPGTVLGVGVLERVPRCDHRAFAPGKLIELLKQAFNNLVAALSSPSCGSRIELDPGSVPASSPRELEELSVATGDVPELVPRLNASHQVEPLLEEHLLSRLMGGEVGGKVVLVQVFPQHARPGLWVEEHQVAHPAPKPGEERSRGRLSQLRARQAGQDSRVVQAGTSSPRLASVGGLLSTLGTRDCSAARPSSAVPQIATIPPVGCQERSRIGVSPSCSVSR